MDLTKEEFVVQAIKKLRDPLRSKGIHVVLSGFNAAFKKQYGEDARATTDAMVIAGKLFVRPTKGGAMIYLPEEAPTFRSIDQIANEALAKIHS